MYSRNLSESPNAMILTVYATYKPNCVGAVNQQGVIATLFVQKAEKVSKMNCALTNYLLFVYRSQTVPSIEIIVTIDGSKKFQVYYLRLKEVSGNF